MRTTANKRNQRRRDAFFHKTKQEERPLVILGHINQDLRRVVERDLRQMK